MTNQPGDESEAGRRGLSRKALIILAVAFAGLIGFAVLYLRYLVPDFGHTEMSGHGTFAVILGVIFSLLIGIGLMALVFLSNRRGYDERVDHRRP